MKLEEIVENRFSGLISIEDLIKEISLKYQCSIGEARHVLAEALGKAVNSPKIYESKRLGPSEVDSFEVDFILKSLSHPEQDPKEALNSGIPF